MKCAHNQQQTELHLHCPHMLNDLMFRKYNTHHIIRMHIIFLSSHKHLNDCHLITRPWALTNYIYPEREQKPVHANFLHTNAIAAIVDIVIVAVYQNQPAQ